MKYCIAGLIGSCLMAAIASAQTVDFPCVPRFRADKSQISTSEATGGMLLLLGKTEIGRPIIATALLRAHDSSLLRASGQLGAGYQEFVVPVDSTLSRLSISVFAECVKWIQIFAPDSSKVEGERFEQGVIALVDEPPQRGPWRVRIAGNGYYSAIVTGKGEISMGQTILAEGKVTAHVSGEYASAELRVLSRRGDFIARVDATLTGTEFTGTMTPPAEPFRLAIEGVDREGLPYRRVHAPLLTAK